MYEIEKRAQIKSVKKIKELIIKNGAKKIDEIQQKDIYFRSIFDKNKKGILRIRIKNDREVILTTKINVGRGDGKWEEKEIILPSKIDLNSLMKIIEFSFFRKEVTIIKKREKYKLSNLIINIDKIKKLGNFIEIEGIAKDKKDISRIRNKINNLLKQLGIPKDNIIDEGYVKLMLKRGSV